MESLLLPAGSCPTLSRKPFFSQKPPPITRPMQVVVSCHNKVDRRNVLLGIGGLYGTGSIMAPDNNNAAIGAPLPPVDMNKCTTGTDLITNQPLDFNCCPPIPEPTPTIYKIPPFTKHRIRKSFQSADKDCLDKYKKAVGLMRALSDKNPSDPIGFLEQANVHCAYCNLTYEQTKDSDIKLQIHNCNHFYPWHRWYIYFYERILGKLLGDPDFALPFWNWDSPDGMVMPDVFTRNDPPPGNPVYNQNRNPNHYPPTTADLLYAGTEEHMHDPPEVQKQKNLVEVYSEMVSNAKSLENFYGDRYSVGSPPGNSPGTVERGSHTAMHLWIGANTAEGYDMGNFSTSGREPIFFTHHTNIDRLWTVWSGLRQKAGMEFYFKDHDWLNSQYLFYDENRNLVQVNVADSLDTLKMGYTYENVPNVWLNNRAGAKKKKSEAAKVSKAPKAEEASVFPAKLDKVIKVLVDRPKKSRSKKDKNQEEELLLIEGIEINTNKFVRFEVFVNDEDDKPEELIGKAEYAGCYSQVRQKHITGVKGRLKLGLTDLLEDLDAEDDDQILVSVVPKAGGEDITIGGIKIIFDSSA